SLIIASSPPSTIDTFDVADCRTAPPLQHTSHCFSGMSESNRFISLFSTNVASSPDPLIVHSSSFFEVALEHARSLEMICIRG
ncbi:hypothetical protein PFISCL1PPCAC_24737, partial [Pristionchus fissidentatus]